MQNRRKRPLWEVIKTTRMLTREPVGPDRDPSWVWYGVMSGAVLLGIALMLWGSTR